MSYNLNDLWNAIKGLFGAKTLSEGIDHVATAAKATVSIGNAALTFHISQLDENIKLDEGVVGSALNNFADANATDETKQAAMDTVIAEFNKQDVQFPKKEGNASLHKSLWRALENKDGEDVGQISSDFVGYLKDDLAKEQHATSGYKLKVALDLVGKAFSFVGNNARNNPLPYAAGVAAIAFEAYRGFGDVKTLVKYGKEFWGSEIAAACKKTAVSKLPEFLQSAATNFLG